LFTLLQDAKSNAAATKKLNSLISNACKSIGICGKLAANPESAPFEKLILFKTSKKK
jgi:hypothetical protein